MSHNIPNTQLTNYRRLIGHASTLTYVNLIQVISYLSRSNILDQTIYFVGGFGDRHYIGYIPLDTYQKAVPTGETSQLHVQDIDNYPGML